MLIDLKIYVDAWHLIPTTLDIITHYKIDNHFYIELMINSKNWECVFQTGICSSLFGLLKVERRQLEMSIRDNYYASCRSTGE